MSAGTGGRIVTHRIESEVLRGNPLRDPTARNLHVYVPPDYDPSHAYPTLLGIVGYTGTGVGLFNQDPLAESLDHRLDRLIAEGRCPPVLIVAPDCFTRVGGSQYINSAAVGRYEDYLLEEVVPYVRDRYACGRWGVFGKSSGGYGSIVLGMRHPDVFEALADHSGDAGFELCYLPEACQALDRFREAGGPSAWLDAFWNDVNRRRRKHARPLTFLGMAAHYSPNLEAPHLGIDFPFELDTGVFRPEVWERWRAWDPVNMVAEHVEGLRRMRLLYVDCGTADEYALHWGARALVAALRHHGVETHYEEFEDGHMAISYRYDVSLPLLGHALC